MFNQSILGRIIITFTLLMQLLVARAAVFTVDTTEDAVDALPGDGVCASGNQTCTLRAAIMETNALSGHDTISLPAGYYLLTLAGSEENAARSGDLDIRDDLTLTGKTAFDTVVDGNRLDRVFHIVNNPQVELSGITIYNGADRGIENAGGGGIRVDSGTLRISDLFIWGNDAGSFIANFGCGGGLFNDQGGTVLLTGGLTWIANNSASYADESYGGGLCNQGQFRSEQGSVLWITGNRAQRGGGVHNNSADFAIANSYISENIALFGAGIYNSKGGPNVKIEWSTISANNGLLGSAAGIMLATGLAERTTIRYSTIQDNFNVSSAGGIGFKSGELLLDNSTVSGNRANSVGGGVALYPPARWISTASTIAYNTALQGGGLYVGGATTDTIIAEQTIFANNIGGNCGGDESPVRSNNYNLDSGSSCRLTGPNDLSNTDPLLGPLADNGGPTLTHALLAGSPAINAGPAKCSPLDQRGVIRPQGKACDIGAYEEEK